MLRADDRAPRVLDATGGTVLAELTADEARALAVASVTLDAAPTDFHTPLLTTAALLGVATSLSGLLLAVVVLRPRRRPSG